MIKINKKGQYYDSSTQKLINKMLGKNDSKGKNKSGRDDRRSFTRTQQKEILYQQNNKCGRCHKPLDPRAIEFDHIKSWADKGRTITQNGAALCGTCHKIKTHNNRLKKINKPKKEQKQPSLYGNLKIDSYDELSGKGKKQKPMNFW